MIRQVVFDFGQVLVHFDPAYMTGQYIKDPEDLALSKDIIFDRRYWDPLDAGTLSDDEAKTLICERLPKRLKEQAVKVYDNWIYHLPEIEGMKEILSYLKNERGLSLYLLSNISQYFAAHAHEISILKAMDGCVFSSVFGYEKPDRRIFDYLCRRYGLLPAETLFVDDNRKNVEAADSFGIHSFLFENNPKSLREWLDIHLGDAI